MKMLDKILQEYAREAYDHAVDAADGEAVDQNQVLAQMLGNLEGAGFAMRYLAADGRIAWKSSPRLRSMLKDMERDAIDDTEVDRENARVERELQERKRKYRVMVIGNEIRKVQQ
jgi:hypothetical protein